MYGSYGSGRSLTRHVEGGGLHRKVSVGRETPLSLSLFSFFGVGYFGISKSHPVNKCTESIQSILFVRDQHRYIEMATISNTLTPPGLAALCLAVLKRSGGNPTQGATSLTLGAWEGRGEGGRQRRQLSISESKTESNNILHSSPSAGGR